MQCITMEKHSSEKISSWATVGPATDELQAPGTNPPIKALRQSRHRVWGLTHRRAVKEETIAINRDWV